KPCRRTSFDAKQWPLLFLCRRMTGAEPWLSLNSNWTVGPQADTVTMAILPGIGIIVVFPVPGCVKADRDPEISGPSQEQAKEEQEQTGRHDAHCGLVRIKGVPEGEQA